MPLATRIRTFWTINVLQHRVLLQMPSRVFKDARSLFIDNWNAPALLVCLKA
jgi:hypothetical protein